MELKHEKVEYIEVEYRDLQQFIKDVYKKNFSFVADNECQNDSQHTFIVKKEELDDYDKEKLKKFKKTGVYDYITSILLTDMCNRGIIEEGMYLITVMW